MYCTWQQEILPTEQWRTIWQQMLQQFDRDSAARVIVEALYLAATQNKETAVADYLAGQLQQGSLTLAALQHHFQLLPPVPLPDVTVQQHELSSYDQLLSPPVNPTPVPACEQPELESESAA